MRTHPLLYQINTRIWLNELGQSLGRPATLDDVADDALDEVQQLGFDWVWLLGIWQTGEAGRRVSANHPGWRGDYVQALPDFREEDVCGSPFAIQNYEVHQRFGGAAALGRFRQRLRNRGIRLMLDFVPNHTALDHPWVHARPEFYVTRPEDDPLLASQPQNYITLSTHQGNRLFAHGRDPYFDGWPDTAQLNYRHSGLRRTMQQEMLRIAGQCDGVRCDMAMLLLPDVIARTWGSLSLPTDGSSPADSCFWPEAIQAVRQTAPEFVFMAEVYWGREWELQQLGFDFTYDKDLYDRLRHGVAKPVREHLWADAGYQARSVRFLENHDEPRAAAVFSPEMHDAAAVIAMLVPGLRFFHEGQLDGRQARASLHLERRRVEASDTSRREFYQRLLAVLRRNVVHAGHWQLLPCRAAWEGNSTFENFIAMEWQPRHDSAEKPLLVVVNFGPTPGQCYCACPLLGKADGGVRLQDLLNPIHYDRDSSAREQPSLYLDMPAWGYHVFEASEDH